MEYLCKPVRYALFATVAIVRTIEHHTSPTKIIYLLEDHTAQIFGHYWYDGTTMAAPSLRLNGYAKAGGGGGIQNHAIQTVFRKTEFPQRKSKLIYDAVKTFESDNGTGISRDELRSRFNDITLFELK